MTFVENLIQDYGLIAMFLLIFLEYACFPVSSEIILPLAGLAGATCHMAFPLLVLISTGAGLAGTLITYFIGRLGGSPLLEKAMARFPSLESPLLKSYRTFGNHSKGAVFFGRLIPLCRTYIGFVAGAMKQDFASYVLYSALGICIWNTVLTGIGYYFYQYRAPFFYYFNYYKKWILLAASFLLCFFILKKIFSTRNKSAVPPAE